MTGVSTSIFLVKSEARRGKVVGKMKREEEMGNIRLEEWHRPGKVSSMVPGFLPAICCIMQ